MRHVFHEVLHCRLVRSLVLGGLPVFSYSMVHQNVVTKKNSNTSNLLTHLQVKYATLYKECQKAMEQKLRLLVLKNPRNHRVILAVNIANFAVDTA